MKVYYDYTKWKCTKLSYRIAGPKTNKPFLISSCNRLNDFLYGLNIWTNKMGKNKTPEKTSYDPITGQAKFYSFKNDNLN